MMTERSNVLRNPFATRWTRPGALPYLFAEGQSAALIVERLAQNNGRGQVIGPHGAGKSTLLATLQGELQRRGIPTLLATLRDGGQGATELWRTLDQWPVRRAPDVDPEIMILLDGAEQLRWLAWRRLLWRCRHRGLGLVVTTHRQLNLPTLLAIKPTVQVAQRVVRELYAGRDPLVDESDVDVAYQAAEGDMREMLFELYHLHEQRARSGRAKIGQ